MMRQSITVAWPCSSRGGRADCSLHCALRQYLGCLPERGVVGGNGLYDTEKPELLLVGA